MGQIDSVKDRFDTDIEVVTASRKTTGIWDRHLTTIGGGAMTCVESDKRLIRVFHDHETHGSYFIQVDGDIETRIERSGKDEMRILFTRRSGAFICGDHLLRLELDAPQTIQDPRGRSMTFRRFRHPECLLSDLLDRVHA